MFDQKYRFQKRQKSIKVHVPTMDDLFNFYVFEIGIFVDFPKGMGYWYYNFICNQRIR